MDGWSIEVMKRVLPTEPPISNTPGSGKKTVCQGRALVQLFVRNRLRIASCYGGVKLLYYIWCEGAALPPTGRAAVAIVRQALD